MISEFTAPRWSKDGARVCRRPQGAGGREARVRPNRRPTSTSGTGRTTEPQSVQIVQVEQARRATWRPWWTSRPAAFARSPTTTCRRSRRRDDLAWAIGRIETPYRGQVVGRQQGRHLSREPRDGRAHAHRAAALAHDGLLAGRQVVPVSEGRPRLSRTNWRPAKKTQIDGDGKSFVNAEDDHDYEKPVYGVAGFSADGKSALLYDRYDVWALPLAGGTAPVNLTKGEGTKQEVRFRVAHRRRRRRRGRRGGGGGGRGGGADGADRLSQAGDAVGLRRVDEEVRLLGTAGRPVAGAAASGSTSPSARRSAAKNADRMIFTEQTFNEYPELLGDRQDVRVAQAGDRRRSRRCSRSSRGARRS